MQAILMPETPKKRRTKTKRDVYPVTFRLLKSVKLALTDISEHTKKSENQQVEQFIRVGYLNAKGINVYGMSELQVIDKFNELTSHLIILEDGDED